MSHATTPAQRSGRFPSAAQTSSFEAPRSYGRLDSPRTSGSLDSFDPRDEPNALDAPNALDSLDDRSRADTHAARTRLAIPPDARAYCSPAACARETADALGLAATIEPALRDADHGDWHGRRLADLAADDPVALSHWLASPDAAPPGGESFATLAARVAGWLDGRDDPFAHASTVVAITHAAVIRAALLHALGAPLATFARIDVAPLTRVVLQRSKRSWVWLAGS